MTSPPRRIVALGASNLTRGFYTLVRTSRERWGADVEILAALGHGRSYGAPSSFIGRTIPGVLESGLWRQLESMPPTPTRSLLTDVGNDILYGQSAAQIVAWVETAVQRLEPFSHEIVLTGLPSIGPDVISNAKFMFFRSAFFPRCRLTLRDVTETAARVNDGLFAIAAAHGARFVQLRRDWYGVDPIHIRPSLWHMAWQQILCGDAGTASGRGSFIEALQLYAMRPERVSFLGMELGQPQTGTRLRRGARVWLY